MTDLLNYASNYMETKMNTENWDALHTNEQEKYLAEAVRQIQSIDGIKLPETFDNKLKIAICEVCHEMLNSQDSEDFEKLKRAGVTSISYGNDSASFDASKSTAKAGNGYINDYAYSLLRPYIQRSYRIV